MTTTRKTIRTLLAAGVVTGAAIGTALADFPRQSFGDLSGDEPVSVRQQQADNARALIAARGLSIRTDAPVTNADYADQAYGDLNGDVPVPVRRLTNVRATPDLLILPSQGDWNGTSTAGPINKEGQSGQ